MPTPEETKEIVRRFDQEVFNAHDLDAADRMIADDFVEHEELPPGMPGGKAGVLALFEHMFKAFPDLTTEIRHLVASEDKVAIHSTMRGTDEGGFMPGMPATGKTFEIGAMDIVRVGDDGRLVEHWGFIDVMSAMIQLGHMPPPPSM
ncbi:MAG: ester cyclase [Actinomycetota bacterium]